MYDFDGTLSPGNMQEYGFLDKLGESSTEFWRKSNEEARKFEMDPISAYMHLMIKETESRALNISRKTSSSSDKPSISFLVLKLGLRELMNTLTPKD